MKAYQKIPKLAHEVAHQYCDGRWIAVGGGGYDIWRVVPRAWAYIWLEMTENKSNFDHIPMDWIKEWQDQSPNTLPAKWEDPEPLYPAIPRKAEITEKNVQTLDKALYLIRNEKKTNPSL